MAIQEQDGSRLSWHLCCPGARPLKGVTLPLSWGISEVGVPFQGASLCSPRTLDCCGLFGTLMRSCAHLSP